MARPKKSDRFEKFLATQTPAALLALVHELYSTVPAAARLLDAAATTRSSASINPAELRAVVNRCSPKRAFIDYREASHYAVKAEEIATAFASALAAKPTQAVVFVEPLEYAVQRIEAQLLNADDSRGSIGVVLGRLGLLHLEACRLCRPDPVALAGRLAALRLHLPFNVSLSGPEAYADILGESGLAEWRRLLEAIWAKRPESDLDKDAEPDDDEDDRGPCFSTVEEDLLTLARVRGDADEEVAILSLSLDSPYDYVLCAEALARVGRDDEALGWARRGVAEHPDSHDRRCVEFILSSLLNAGKLDEAGNLAESEWRRTKDHARYLRALTIAERRGERAAVRDRLVAELDTALVGSATSLRRGPSDHLARARLAVAVEEGDLDEALRVLADSSERTLVLPVAQACSLARRDAEAARLFVRIAESTPDATRQESYHEAATYAAKAVHHLRFLGREAESADFLARLRKTHRPKVNFMARLDAAGC